MLDFKGKRIMVIGASSGIGKKTAEVLLQSGAQVLLLARSLECLETIKPLSETDSVKCYQADVTEIATLSDVVERIVRENGKLDGMVYTAGISEDMPVKNLNYQRIMKTFNTNFFGFIEMVRQVTMRRNCNESMSIVAVSSVSSMFGEKAHTAYAASKAAMDASVRCISKELAQRGVRINSVAPSMIRTAMTEKMLEFNGEENANVRRTLDRQSLGMGEPIDVANAIVFLLSDEAKFITGVTLPVDGGFTANC